MYTQCKNCQTIFIKKSNSQKFCSKECKRLFNEIELICEWCNKKFKTIDRTKRFCNNSCSTKHQMSSNEMKENIQIKRKKTIEKNGGLFKHTEEWKKNMSIKMRNRNITWGDKISKVLKGKPHPNNRKNFKHSEKQNKF